MWRSLLRRLAPSLQGRATAEPVETDVWASVGRIARPESTLLSQIEQTALEVYAEHGLPTRRGHYRRAPRARTWTFIGEDLPPEARWAEMMEHGRETGWRYSALRDLGRSGPPEVRSAADLLTACALLRERLKGAGTRDLAEDMEMAIRLGADWRALEILRARGSVRLQLTAPGNELPAPAQAPATRRGRGKTRP